MSYDEDRLHHTPWVEKYRPKSLGDVASQDHAVKVLQKTLHSANLPHMLFYGPPGTGKTSTVLALARELYGPSLSKLRVLELNASDERGILIVRQKIKNFARLTVLNPSPDDLQNYPCPPYKIIILDEADLMTNDAQLALRRTMETYLGVTRFCLICNYITRIIDPLALRCLKFRFRLLDGDSALARLQHIAQEEQVKLADDSVLPLVLKLANGDLRKAITYLQSAVRLSEDQAVSGQVVQELAGVVPNDAVLKLSNAVEGAGTAQIMAVVNELVLSGWSAQQLVGQLHDAFLLNDNINENTKNEIAGFLLDTDRRLANGTDEHVQLLNLCLQISEQVKA